MLPRSFAALLALAALAALPGCAPHDPDPRAAAFGPPLPATPPELAQALDRFRAEGPKGWAFTQNTSGQGKNRVERHDPSRRGEDRWTLLSENGKPPTEAEQRRYRDTRPPHEASSNLAAQLDRSRVALVSEDAAAGAATYEFALNPASEKDAAAAHMRARVTLHRTSGAIVRVELFNLSPFKPASSLLIEEARTTLVYSVPSAPGQPALPLESTMRVKGKRFWFRDFEQTVTSTFGEHENKAKAGARE